MKKILLHISLLFFFGAIFAQESTSDSLIALSREVSGSELAHTYFLLSEHLLDTLPDSALYYANQAEVILSKNDPNGLLPPLFKLKGSIYDEIRITDRSLFYYRKAYDEFIKLGDNLELGSCALRLGNIYYELGDFGEAYFFYMQSLNAYEQNGDQLGIAKMQNNLGTVAHEMGKLDEAEGHYFIAFEIYKDIGTISDQCRSLNNIGLILYDRQAYDSALVYFMEGIELQRVKPSQTETDQYILTGLYNNMGLVYSDMKEYKRALSILLM
ncbi:MAG: tetratricopeptide repeat protein, partial [Bacteroides sp.]|nr:tetratricopeptide repeat protein [Bacteroides sp.]